MKAYQLPPHLAAKVEWTFVGPMGPNLHPELEAYPILAVDGGAHYSTKIDVWVGDKDSFEGEVKSEVSFSHPPAKDVSDLGLALHLLTHHLHYRLHFWGFLGGRKDHELFNLGEGLHFLERHPESQIILYNDKKQISFHLLGEGHWKFKHEGLFSLGTLKPTKVKLKGDCRFPIKDALSLSPLSSFGLSNEAHGDIHLETKGPVFIYYPEGK